jgi:hypothetical protein
MLAISQQSTDSDSHVVLQLCIELLAERGSPSFVVFLTDSWNAPRFEQQVLPDLQRAYANGNRFLFLLVGSPDTSISRVPLAFETPEMAISASERERPKRSIMLN